MARIVIFGNAGSGKSTLAKALSRAYQAEHFDLDTIAWRTDQPTVRAHFADSQRMLLRFIETHDKWIIEGCYSDLLKEATAYCTEMIFLNPGIEACVENCRNRPWEPHKYESSEAQNANLELLINWVREYETRSDEFSLQAHQKLYEQYQGKKTEYKTRDDTSQRIKMSEAS